MCHLTMNRSVRGLKVKSLIARYRRVTGYVPSDVHRTSFYILVCRGRIHKAEERSIRIRTNSVVRTKGLVCTFRGCHDECRIIRVAIGTERAKSNCI